ncbi:MAG TPA: hypothetical protein VNI83_07595 [Vicinamibacterales bacterium]|nr:hypothetical protein [Vicinamibacterales bacterium]
MVSLRRLRPAGFAALIALGSPCVAGAQESRSAAPARELAQLMEQRQLQYVAVKDPSQPDRYVAALYLAGQLYVVSARYSAPPILDERLAKKEYQEIYIDLNSASIPQSKIFVEDSNADGLRPKPDDGAPADSFESGNRRTLLDGGKKANLSEEQYQRLFDEADQQYTQMLTLLVGQLKKPSTDEPAIAGR